MKHIIVIIAALSLSSCAWLGLGKAKVVAAVVYPQVKLTTTEDAVNKTVTDRIVFTDMAANKAKFQERIDEYVNDGGWKIVIPAYLNSLPGEYDFGVYIATLERVRPQ